MALWIPEVKVTQQKKKVVFIKVHPIFAACPEKEWVLREFRERWIIRQTAQLGYDAKLFLLSDSNCVWSYPDDVEVTFFPVDNKKMAKNSHTSQLMLDRLYKELPDLIVFKGMNYVLSKWILSQLKTKFAFIVGGHCVDKFMNQASYVLAETQDQVNDFFKNIPSAVFPKTLDLSLFKPNPNKVFDIVNVGSFEHRKNQKALINLTYKYKVALIGDGPDFHKIRASVHPDTYMPRNLAVEEVANVIASSKIMVHSSIWEGFPRVLIESMACGVPFIALSSTIKGIVTHNENCLLVNETEIDDTVNILLNDKELYEKLSKNGRELAISNFGKEATIPVLEKMFKHIFQED